MDLPLIQLPANKQLAFFSKEFKCGWLDISNNRSRAFTKTYEPTISFDLTKGY